MCVCEFVCHAMMPGIIHSQFWRNLEGFGEKVHVCMCREEPHEKFDLEWLYLTQACETCGRRLCDNKQLSIGLVMLNRCCVWELTELMFAEMVQTTEAG